MTQPTREAFKKFGPGRDVSSEGEVLLDNIRGHVWQRYAGKFEDLAAIALLHPKTVEDFAWGKTRRPHFETIVRILSALGLHHKVAQVLGIDQPISREAAANQRNK